MQVMKKLIFLFAVLTTTVKAEVVSMVNCNNISWPTGTIKYVDYTINLKTNNVKIDYHFYKKDNNFVKNYRIISGNVENGIVTEQLPIMDKDGKITIQSSSYILYPRKSYLQWNYFVNGNLQKEHSMKNGRLDCERVVFN
jgi:hypothetical protein